MEQLESTWNIIDHIGQHVLKLGIIDQNWSNRVQLENSTFFLALAKPCRVKLKNVTSFRAGAKPSLDITKILSSPSQAKLRF